jgi:arginase family enzyme
MNEAVHLNLDDAWEEQPLGMPCVDAREWGPRLRYFAPAKLVEVFSAEVLAALPPFVVYGSGDFHYLAACLAGRVREALTVVSFDNHPDWDIRPPRWACGGWVNRALDNPFVQRVAVWGCGNFELNWPSRLFGNRRAICSGRLEVHAWAERFGKGVRRRFDCMTRENWRERFSRFVQRLAGSAMYVTVDLDCLRSEEAATNWENGLFTAEDVAWALRKLRESCRVVGGDLCGAYSRPRFARWTQRLASGWDHPKIREVSAEIRIERNLKVLRTIWSEMVSLSFPEIVASE